MARIWMPGGGGGADLDVTTAVAGDILKGKVIVGPDREPLTGTLELTGNAADSQVLAGKTYYNTDAKTKRTGIMVNHGAIMVSLNCGKSFTIPAGYHNGAGEVIANSLTSQTDSTAVAGDILSGKTAWVKGSKITGNMATMAGGTYTPSTSQQTVSCSGKKMTSDIIVKGDANLIAGNIIAGKSIFGVAGNAKVVKMKSGYTGIKSSGTVEVYVMNAGSESDTYYWEELANKDITPVLVVFYSERYISFAEEPFSSLYLCSYSKARSYRMPNGSSFTSNLIKMPFTKEAGSFHYIIAGY